MNRADDETGGSLRAAVNVAEAMAAAGASVTFSAPVFKERATDTVSSASSNIAVQLFPTVAFCARFGASFRQIRWLLRRAGDFDAIHIHTIFHVSAVYAALISIYRRTPYFYWPHGSLLPYDLEKHHLIKQLLEPALRWLLRRSSGIVCVSAREADETVDFGARARRVTVPLPVPSPMHSSIGRTAWRRMHSIPADSFLVLFLGRLDYKKRLDRLIDAIALLPSEFRLAIVGATSGPEASSIRRLIVTERVESRVHVIGWLEGEQRSSAFESSDCFVLSSDNENFGIAVVEALHMGLPVIISDQVYISEDLKRLGCAIVSESTPQAVAESVRRLASDQALRRSLVECGKRVAAERYEMSAVGRRILGEATH